MSLDPGENSQLAGIIVCISGDPTGDKDTNRHIREQFTDENISRWLKYRGGRLTEQVTEATTHLICSRKAYTKRATNDKIKTARKLGCHIVTYEWLADTLQLLDYHKRKAPPRLYHPGEVRDDEAISALFRKPEKKVRASKKKALTATVFTTVGGEGDTRDGQAAGNVPEQLATSGDRSTQKSSKKKDSPESSNLRNSKVIKTVDGMERLGNPVDYQADKPAGKPTDGAKPDNHQPHVDLSRFTIYRDNYGPYQVEVIDRNGARFALELYESKATPKTYLFSVGEYLKATSSKCKRKFPSKTPGDKYREIERFKSRFWRISGKRWRQGQSISGDGSSPGHQPRPVPTTTINNATNKSKPDGLGKFKKESHTAKSLVVPHGQSQVDLKTSFKRKNSFSEHLPAKELKVTKYSIAGGSGRSNNGKSKTL
ncbi:hypothetical protein KVR01_004646 [Diaporthe batatas]|uniref:uncharacterized protein n=1 Tax=Diaporthe batatas TaxID=748121 RepID=UPI001D0594C6|nr:uncharacterized protein KVR01_004646 [Diaporthe batatas]KAG8166094.1 hypothetical protein KVR01_004646 [Diaporthe batatas]